jgi:hypothetical protein
VGFGGDLLGSLKGDLDGLIGGLGWIIDCLSEGLVFV